MMKKVAKFIETENRFDLSSWLSVQRGAFKQSVPERMPNPTKYAREGICGTTCCIGGAALAVAGAPKEDWSDVHSNAIDVLGLTYDQGDELFMPGSDFWESMVEEGLADRDPDFEYAVRAAPTAKQAAKILRKVADGKLELVPA